MAGEGYYGGQPDAAPSYGASAEPAAQFSAEQEVGDGGAIDRETGGFTTAKTFSDRQVRRNFIKKVYITLTIQLLVTFGIVCVFTFVDEVRRWVQANSGFYYASYAVFIVVYLLLACVEPLRRKSPLNLVMLGVLTLSLSYMAGTIASFYDSHAVVICIAITMGVTIGVTIFCMQTKYDFTALIGIAFVLTLAVLLFGFISIFTYNNIMDTVIGLICALLLVLWLAIDTQLICGGKKHELSPEEYIMAALCLYIDIVYLFLIILSIVEKGQ
ncbi:protein lifeguard 1-like [Ptychodera flava]|uniref:protein lifeguard 1-like n=1 Tax=Ptychodera flava TaxID=63121 RepID=UPI00396A7FF4